MHETDNTKKAKELFSELEHYNEDEQKQKIEEMIEVMDGMKKDDFLSIFDVEVFSKIEGFIEEKKTTMENAMLLLKHIGYLKVRKDMFIFGFDISLLKERIEQMIFDEKEKKNEEKNEKLLVDLCECFVLFCDECISDELISICVPCILKAALNKEENKEAQKEVEMALLALGCFGCSEMRQENFLDEIKEIIIYNQEHHNLTRIAYQSAWQFLIRRILFDRSLEEVVVNELHLARDTARELEELMKCVDWKREKEAEKEGKESKEELILMRWLHTLNLYFSNCELQNEEFIVLLSNVERVLRAAKDNHREICDSCIRVFEKAAERRAVKVYHLLESGAVDVVLEEILQSTINDRTTDKSFSFLKNVSMRTKWKKKDRIEESKTKVTKRKIFEKMEEEGYEDIVASFHGIFYFLTCSYSYEVSFNISDYFVNA